MKIDLSITISAILGCAAIIVPTLGTILTNAHQSRMKKLELKQLRYEQNVIYVRDILQNYLKAVSAILTRHRSEDLCFQYGEYYALAYIYASTKSKSLMKEANDYIVNPSAYDTRWSRLEELAESLYSDLLNLSKK